MIGTHNSMSYLPLQNWWLYPFRFIGKCQNTSIYSQMLEHCVSMIDIRVRFDKKGNWYYCHGLLKFEHSISQNIYEVINSANILHVTVRIILETSKEDSFQEDCFSHLINDLKELFPKVKFVGGNRKFDWKKVVDLPEVVINQYVGSMNKLAWFPWLYAKLNNRKNKAIHNRDECKNSAYALFDFI